MRLDDDIPASRPTLLMGQTKTVHNSLGCECPHGRTATDRPYDLMGTTCVVLGIVVTATQSELAKDMS